MIHTYFCKIDMIDDDKFKKIYESMPKWRKERADSMKNTEDKKCSLAAGMLLDRLLADFFRLDFRELEPAFKEKGKPYFKDKPGIHFSMSHSGSMVMCSAGTKPNGCDIQKIGENKAAVAKRYFNPLEYEQLCSISSLKKRNEMFYTMWAAKESYVKMTGEGISSGLDLFCVNTEPYWHIKGADCGLNIYRVGEYVMSVCVQKNGN